MICRTSVDPHLTLPRKDLGADTWFNIDFTAAPEDATAPSLVPHPDYQLDNVRPKRVILDRLENKKISQSWSKAIKINSSVPSVTGMVIESSSFMWHDTGTGLASTCLITKAGRCTSSWMDDLSDKSRYVTPYDASTSVNQAVAHVVDQIQVLHKKHKLYQKKGIWICYSLIHMIGLYLVTIHSDDHGNENRRTIKDYEWLQGLVLRVKTIHHGTYQGLLTMQSIKEM